MWCRWQGYVLPYNCHHQLSSRFSLADRRPIDPPPIVQLRVIDPSTSNAPSSNPNPPRRRRTSSTGSAPGSPTPSASSRYVPIDRVAQAFLTILRHHPDPDSSDRHADPSTPSAAVANGRGDNAAGYAQSFLQNPYYFMFASLAKPDDDAELHWLKVNGRHTAMVSRD